MANLTDMGIGIMVAAVVIGGVAIPVAGDALVTDTENIDEEIFTPDELPETFTLEGEELVEDSETIELYDGVEDTTTTLTEGTDYEINYTSTELEILENADYDSEEDEFRASYEYYPHGYIDGMAGNIAQYVTLALALALFVAAIALVRG